MRLPDLSCTCGPHCPPDCPCGCHPPARYMEGVKARNAMQAAAAREQAEWERIKKAEADKAEAEFRQPQEDAAMPKTKKPPHPSLIEYPVAYGVVSIGETTARLGITISRGNIDAEEADKNLCGRRLTGTVIAAPNGADPDQKPLPGLQMGHEIRGVFDVKRIGLSPQQITAGLTFPLDGLDLAELAKFAGRDGRVVITEVATLDEEEEEEGGEDA